MQHVIVAWCETDTEGFESLVPLAFAGERHHRLGYSNDAHVVFLSGLSSLSSSYRDRLKALGYQLHDAQRLYCELAKRYNALDRFGSYGKNCFLRWFAIENIFAGEPIIHLDGDVVLNECPTIIDRKLQGLTFVLQGCPALSVISDYAWFEQYGDAIERFTADIDDYSAQAWTTRRNWETTFKTRWAGSRFQPIFTHDQDLLSHLIHSGGIKQDSPESVLSALDGYAVFENPLLIHMYCETFPFTYSREKGVDFLSYHWLDAGVQEFRKRVLLWHMQTSFSLYASQYLLRRRFGLQGLRRHLPFSINSTGLEERINSKINRFTHHQSRLSVYGYFFRDGDFRGLMNGATWWQPGVFN
jgi:hypothetical protein